MYHIFFIHSSIRGNLGCFHILDTVNNVAIVLKSSQSFSLSHLFSVLAASIKAVKKSDPFVRYRLLDLTSENAEAQLTLNF